MFCIAVVSSPDSEAAGGLSKVRGLLFPCPGVSYSSHYGATQSCTTKIAGTGMCIPMSADQDRIWWKPLPPIPVPLPGLVCPLFPLEPPSPSLFCTLPTIPCPIWWGTYHCSCPDHFDLHKRPAPTCIGSAVMMCFVALSQWPLPGHHSGDQCWALVDCTFVLCRVYIGFNIKHAIKS